MHLEACFDQDDHDGDVDDDDDDDDNDDDGDAGFVAPPSLGQLSHIGKVSSSVVSFPSFFIAFQTEETNHSSFPVNPISCGSG